MSNVNTNKPASAPSNEKPNTATATQTKPPTTPGSAAATAAAAVHTPLPYTEDKPSTASTSKAPASPTEDTQEGDDEKEKIQYHVITGKVETFPDTAKAEAFLNAPEAPQVTVIYGKVSLANEWHITTGSVRTFPSLVKAQKFLKTTVPGECVMIRGRITIPELRVSLRK